MRKKFIFYVLVVSLILALPAFQIAYKKIKQSGYFDQKLLEAAYSGEIGSMKLLLKMGADIDARDDDGQTALMHAADNGRVVAVRFLLKNGADANAKDNIGRTALMYAVMPISVIISGSGSSEIDIAQLLLDNGADVNATDNEGATALMLAFGMPCSTNDDEACNRASLLIANGVDVNAMTKSGCTALNFVFGAKGHKLLIDAGARKGDSTECPDVTGYICT